MTPSVKPKLLFVSLCNAQDPNADSGYSYSMRAQLKQRYDVVDLFLVGIPGDRFWLPVRAAYKAAGRYYFPMREPLVLRALARRVERAISETKPQLVFASSSIPLSLVDTSLPLIHVTDQVFCDFVNTYIDKPSVRFRRIGNAQEAIALAAATRVSYPSEWAALSAIKHYGQDPSKIVVVPWGGNLPREIGEEEAAAGIESRRLEKCHLVFLGRDWHRKGGDILAATVAELNRKGLETRATIIGCSPVGLPPDRFTIYPFLNKSDPLQFEHFATIMREASFLFVPSRAEAFGQAYCEAAAFGLPSIASMVGGIPVRDGETGYLCAKNTTVEQYSYLILETLNAPERYVEMAHAARRDYSRRLNWKQFGDKLSDVISEII
jgi:glycosyltransferase involved in cell wall biosynthesis